jgi:hypothetical protein
MEFDHIDAPLPCRSCVRRRGGSVLAKTSGFLRLDRKLTKRP